MYRLSVLIISCAVLTVSAAAQELPVVSAPPFSETIITKPTTPPFELSQLRTDRSRSYLNTDGTVTARISAGLLPEQTIMMAPDSKSGTEQARSSYPQQVETSRYIYRYDTNDPLAGYRIERGGYYVEFTPIGDRAGITSTITPGTAGTKEDVVFSKTSSRSVSWRITTDAVMKEHDGGLVFTNRADMFLFTVHPADAFDTAMKPVEVSTTLKDSVITYTIEPDDSTVWPVTLDPGVTTTGMLDGRIESPYEPVYADSRNASGGTNNNSAIIVGQTLTDEYRIYRSYLAFPIPDLASASACTLYIDGRSNQSATDFDLYVLGASQYRPELDSNDFIRFDGYQSGSQFTGTILNESWNSEMFTLDWNTIVFNAAGLDSIVAAANDTLWIALVSNRDYLNSEPSENEYLMFSSSVSVDREPYLSLVYSPLNPPPSEVASKAHADGRIRAISKPSYAAARDTTSAIADNNWTQVGQWLNSTPSYYVYRGFFSFEVPDFYSVQACTLYVHGYTDSSDDTDFDVYLIGADDYGPVLENSDFPRFNGRTAGSPHTGTILNEAWSSVSFSSGWNAIVFNPAGLDSVAAASGDTLRIAMISSNDYSNTPPAGYEYLLFDSSSSPGFEPYLSIDFDPGILPPATFAMSALDDSTIACTWNDVGNETAYHIVNWADTSLVATLPANATADTISGLSPNTRYTWAVVADSLGLKGVSAPDSCYTLLSPPALTGIRIMPISSDTLRITAAAPPNGTSGATGMEIEAITGPGADGSGQLTGTYTFRDGGLDNDASYSYRARYFNGDGIPSAWSEMVTYTMNGLATVNISLAGDAHDDYTSGTDGGIRTATVIRAGAGSDGTVYDGYLTFVIPWQVLKGGIDSLFVTLTRDTGESLSIPELTITGIPTRTIGPAEYIDLGAQEMTIASVSWTVAAGTGARTSPNLRDIFREWQDAAPFLDYPGMFGIRLGGSGQADSVSALFRDASHASWDGDTYLTVCYTPGTPDSLDAAPQNFTLTALSPGSVLATWTDEAAYELGFVIMNAADSTVVAGTDSLAADTASYVINGLTPNTVYHWFIKAYTAIDDSSSASSSIRTPARIPGTVTVAALSDTSLSFVIDPADNPSSTAFAVQDSLTGFYIDGTVEPAILRTEPPGEWAWRTYANWGLAAGDTLTGLAPDSLYVLRAKARTDE